MAQVPSMPHRHFQLLVKIQRENEVRLIEGHDNNKAGKFTYLLKSYILNYFNFISGSTLLVIYRSIGRTYKNVSVYSKSSHWKCSIKKVFLKVLQYSPKNTCVRVSFFKVTYKVSFY